MERERAPDPGPVDVVMLPDDEPATGHQRASVTAVDELENLPPVRDALRAAVLSLPSRDPRQTKAFINLWRFYMVLEHRMGLLSPSLLAVERHSIEMARLVELMVRWPHLLAPLGEPAVDETIPPTLDLLLDACFGNEEEPWASVARQVGFNPDDRAVQALRQFLRQALPYRDVFRYIAVRYL
jgi:AcrR family transcriptional regulator